MALATSDGHCRVVSHDLTAHHGDGFTLCGVHFARHDGGAGLQVGKGDLADACARAASLAETLALPCDCVGAGFAAP